MKKLLQEPFIKTLKFEEKVKILTKNIQKVKMSRKRNIKITQTP